MVADINNTGCTLNPLYFARVVLSQKRRCFDIEPVAWKYSDNANVSLEAAQLFFSIQSQIKRTIIIF